MSEAWKGESEDDETQKKHPSFLSFGIQLPTPTEPSEEDIEQKKLQSAANKALGNLNYPTLKPFDPARPCPKCQGAKRSIRYCPGVHNDWCEKEAGDHAHIHVRCKTCKYFWTEKTLDADTE